MSIDSHPTRTTPARRRARPSIKRTGSSGLEKGAESVNSDTISATRNQRSRRGKRQRKQHSRPILNADSPNPLSPSTPPGGLPDASPNVAPPPEFVPSNPQLQSRTRQTEISQRYYDETRRPIVCLAFVFPLLIFYEIGSILLGHESFRSGIDQWLHQALHQLGFGQLVILPLVAMAVMIVWHHRDQDHWRIRGSVLAGMLTEAIGLGLILFCAASAISMLAFGPAVAVETLVSTTQWWATVVGLVGSGIYEELVFRIILLVPVIYCASRLIADRRWATVAGVILISLLFAAVHYNMFNPAGSQFELSSFAFRFVASIVFCVLFLFRGFAIAVGAHVAYDVFTQV